jgi:transposase
LAVARGFLREPDLPVASHDEMSRELKLLVDRREDLVTQRTATINRLLWRVHELDPEHAPKPRSLNLAKHRGLLGDWLDTQTGIVAELARDELADITRLTKTIDGLATRIGRRVREIAPVLVAMPGCGELTAAKLVGEAAGVTRFKSEAAFARHAGVAPVPVWSGNTRGRVRMTRSGNRQLNAALHRIAVTQIRLDGLGQTYYRHRLNKGDSTPEALRCLKRRLARVVFGHLQTDHNNRQKPCQMAAA